MTSRRRLEAAVETVNQSRADACVLTGDFVGRGGRFLPLLTRTLARLHPPCVAVLGNHDHFVGASRVVAALAAAGIPVVQNGVFQLPLQTGPLAIACLDDSTTRNDDVVRTVRGLVGPALGLAHNPRSAPLLWANGVRLVLSGHTHGGQVVVPHVTERVHRALGNPFLAGLYERPEGTVYVNAGLGATTLSLRIGAEAQPEIALITLIGTE